MKQTACRLLLVLALAMASGRLLAQSPSTPPALSADLARYYFSTPAAEAVARADLDTTLDQLRRFKGQINSAAQLLGALRNEDRVQELYARHEGYLHLLCSLNRKDAACDADQKLESDVYAKTAFLNPEILTIPEDRLRGFLTQGPALAPYRFAVAEIRRDEPYSLPGPEQAFLDEFQPQIADWQYDLYQQIVAVISFGTVQTKSGPRDVIRQRSLIGVDTDGKVREEGFKRRYAGFASQRDLIAFALIHTVPVSYTHLTLPTKA